MATFTALMLQLGMSVLQFPSLVLLEHVKPCRKWGFVGGLRSVKVPLGDF